MEQNTGCPAWLDGFKQDYRAVFVDPWSANTGAVLLVMIMAVRRAIVVVIMPGMLLVGGGIEPRARIRLVAGRVGAGVVQHEANVQCRVVTA